MSKMTIEQAWEAYSRYDDKYSLAYYTEQVLFGADDFVYRHEGRDYLRRNHSIVSRAADVKSLADFEALIATIRLEMDT